ncbi:MAG: dickkopf-related protein [Archangium sp.]
MSPPDAGAPDCADDTDCPDRTYFFCDTQTSKCTPTCKAAEQCNMRPEQFALKECEGELGCVCDLGRCFAAQCASDADCPGAACRNGACAAPPSADAVVRCAVTPDFVIAAADQPLTFSVSTWDRTGEPIVISAGATWTALGASVSGTPPAGLEASFTARGPGSAATAAVRATIGGVQCDARVQLLPAPVAADGTVISVIDERTGRAIAGAQVMLSSPQGAQLQLATTNADGWVELTNVATNSVSVFHADFSYQTLVAVPDAPVLRVGLQRNPLDRLGGYTVTPAFPLTSNVHLSRVGLSSSTDVSALTLTDDFEPIVPVTVIIGSAINQPNTPIPLGTVMNFGDQLIKPAGSAFGVNGVCRDLNGAVDEASTANGTCGAQSMWMLSNDTPLGSIPLDLGNGVTLPFLAFLSRSESFGKYQSSVERDVQFPLRLPPASGVGDLSDRSNFVSAQRAFGQLRLGLQATVKPAQFTTHAGQPISNLLLTSVALQPGRGLVPLGLGYGADTTPTDGRVDPSADLRTGLVRLRAAPAHHGLEGTTTAVLTQLVSNAWFGNPEAGRANSTVLTRLAAGTVKWDQDATTVIDQTMQPFPTLVENSKWNAQPISNRGLAPRSFSVAPREDVSVVKVSIKDALGAKWDVLVDPRAPNFTLPTVPGTMRDRLFDLGLSTGKPSGIELQSLRFSEPVFSDRQVGYAEWVAAPHLRDQLRHLTAWSRLEVRKLSLVLTSPLANSELTDSRNIVVAVEGVALGPSSSASVALRFKGGTGCVDVITSFPIIRVPPECHGNSVTIEAELLDENLDSYIPTIQSTVSNVRIP